AWTKPGLPTAAELPSPQLEPYITKVEVAQRLGKTVRCIDNWMKRGLIPFYKIGRSVCFKWSDVDSHLSQTCRVSQRTYAAAAYQVGGSSPIANRK
ncbi:MAG: excisionase family DNA-binding protein, partial [Limisphaerales bacterium]